MQVKQREDTIAEKQQFFDAEVENNRELEKKIGLAERTQGKLRMDYQERDQERDQFGSEVGALLSRATIRALPSEHNMNL